MFYILGIITGLLLASLVVLVHLWVLQNPVVAQQLKALLPKQPAGIYLPKSRNELDRLARVEQAEKLHQDIDIDDVL